MFEHIDANGNKVKGFEHGTSSSEEGEEGNTKFKRSSQSKSSHKSIEGPGMKGKSYSFSTSSSSSSHSEWPPKEEKLPPPPPKPKV